MDTPANKPLTVEQVAEYLQVSVETVRSYIKNKKHPLPAARLGREYRIMRADLDQWMEERKSRPEEK